MKTQEETKHTPTPWKLSNGINDFPSSLFDEHGNHLTDVKGYGQFSEQNHANAAFIVRAVNSHEALLEFAKNHHEVCGDCEGTGKIYNNADPTSGQWVECPYSKIIAQAEGQ